ncbi:uncharacterized protein LOC111398010 [Olea europaea var. sylvestris]|uniref:uncharacterized protein LOC111398010 n=1 Tax=Olea europaea var. sylvestris TaxID=158386 RepID=UPI000C1D2109|nr:uncharacterized protein LOC111398010 [Olea europaea var. sylvestris]
MGSDKQPVGLLDTLNMDTVRTIFMHTYPYPHEHSRHAVIAVAVGCLFFISSDNMYTLVQKLDSNIKWWSMYIAWILIAALYHLPSFQSMGVDMRMNLSLFLTIFVSSILFLLVFHVIFLGLWYVGLVARVAGKRPAILTILQNCAVIGIACCVFYSHCGNRAILRAKTFERRNSGWFTFWKKEERNSWLAKFVRMNQFKDQVCSSWFAPVGSASDYPFLSKWVIYGESLNIDESGTYSMQFSRSSYLPGLLWALTHPVSQKEFDKLKKKQMNPDFLDMVPWYSGTSTDLFKTVFDLLVSVTVFVGRFDMRMMQAAMSKVEDGADQDDLLYDQFSEKDELWFDFMADTGDGGNSSYSVARLLAQPSIRVQSNNSLLTLPRGNLLLIGGDLAKMHSGEKMWIKRGHINTFKRMQLTGCNVIGLVDDLLNLSYPNPSAFTYERRFFRPFEYALQPPFWYKEDHIAVNKPELPSGVTDLKQYEGPQCFVIPGNHGWLVLIGLMGFRHS